MNLWWDIFSVSDNAIGGWLPFALQTFTIIIAVVGTLYLPDEVKASPLDIQ
jgi:hypothetical protein